MTTRLHRAVLTTLALFIIFFGTATSVLGHDCTTEQTTAEQQKTSAILSEVYPSPNSEEEEFIELHNTDSEPLDVDGWILADASGKQYAISSEEITTRIAGDGYLAIPQSVSGIYLNNGGDSVLLKTADGTIISETTYEEADKGLSWTYANGKWQWSTSVTEGKKNVASDDSATDNPEELPESTIEEDKSISSKEETSNALLVNELMPNPLGSETTDEWIELFNSGDTAVYLGGWQLTDQSHYYEIGDMSINAGEYIVFEIAETGISLNNTGDTLYLIDPYEKIIHGTTYGASEEGLSWAFIDNEWQWTEELTPGAKNIASATVHEEVPEDEKNESTENAESNPENSTAIAISEFRSSVEDGDAGTIVGTVTALPDTFGSQYFYIQDDTAGIQVYSYKKDFPALSIGDRVQVHGEKSTTREETRIKTSTLEDIVLLGQNEIILPAPVTELNESIEGMLVSVDGTILEESSTEAIIAAAIKILFKSSAKIDTSIVAEGTEMVITGIVSQSNDEYRLQPRNTADLALKESSDDEFAFIEPANAAGFTGNSSNEQSTIQDSNRSIGLFVAIIIGLLLIIGVSKMKHEPIRKWLIEKLQHKTELSSKTKQLKAVTPTPKHSLLQQLREK